jgi:hypothetical protein
MDISKLYKQLLHANSASVKHKGRRFVLGGTYSLSGISRAVLGHPLRKVRGCRPCYVRIYAVHHINLHTTEFWSICRLEGRHLNPEKLHLWMQAVPYVVVGHGALQDSQCSDWEQRPLTEDQIYYAASDTHCLLAIFDTLLSDALALISPAPAPAPAHTEAGDKPDLMIQQRASSIRDMRGAGLKLLTGAGKRVCIRSTW